MRLSFQKYEVAGDYRRSAEWSTENFRARGAGLKPPASLECA
jgi:hypothetical protein